jgi:hypothetical protein
MECAIRIRTHIYVRKDTTKLWQPLYGSGSIKVSARQRMLLSLLLKPAQQAEIICTTALISASWSGQQTPVCLSWEQPARLDTLFQLWSTRGRFIALRFLLSS